MGQGILTALCMIAAEELDCDWKSIHTEFAPAAKGIFQSRVRHAGHRRQLRAFGSSWDPMRQGRRGRAQPALAAGRGGGMEGRQGLLPHGKRRDLSRRVEAKSHVRKRRRGRVKTSGPDGRTPQRSEELPHPRKADEASRHTGQGERRRGIRPRREAAGHDVRRGGARCPVFRRKSREL